MNKVEQKMSANEYIMKKLKESVPGLTNKYIPCVTEIELFKNNKMVIKCVDLEGVVIYRQEIIDYSVGTKITISDLNFKLEE